MSQAFPPSIAPASSPGQPPPARWVGAHLYVTAALGGGAIMIVEIMGTKTLAPYVGLTHFVWTAQIAVPLLALSVGYYFGGRLATARRALPWLFAAYAVAGLYLLGGIAFCARVALATRVSGCRARGGNWLPYVACSG